MSTLNLKSVTTIAAACALSLVSAATFAGPGGRGGGAPATSRMSAPAMGGADRSTMRQDTMGASARLGATPTAMSARPTATTTKTTTTTAKSTTTTHMTGQPNASCEDNPNQPGHSISAPGSAFNPDGIAGTKYAGEQLQNQKNPNSVSQYDVACTRPVH
jgi:hypothetical protein